MYERQKTLRLKQLQEQSPDVFTTFNIPLSFEHAFKPNATHVKLSCSTRAFHRPDPNYWHLTQSVLRWSVSVPHEVEMLSVWHVSPHVTIAYYCANVWSFLSTQQTSTWQSMQAVKPDLNSCWWHRQKLSNVCFWTVKTHLAEGMLLIFGLHDSDTKKTNSNSTQSNAQVSAVKQRLNDSELRWKSLQHRVTRQFAM